MGVAAKLAAKYGAKYYKVIMRWIGSGYSLDWITKKLKKMTHRR